MLPHAHVEASLRFLLALSQSVVERLHSQYLLVAKFLLESSVFLTILCHLFDYFK